MLASTAARAAIGCPASPDSRSKMPSPQAPSPRCLRRYRPRLSKAIRADGVPPTSGKLCFASTVCIHRRFSSGRGDQLPFGDRIFVDAIDRDGVVGG